MRCTCGHDEDQHQEMNDELVCFVILSTDENFNDYCQCMKYEPDKDAQLAALRDAGEKMALQLRELRAFSLYAKVMGAESIMIKDVLEDTDPAVLAEWEAANK